METQPSVQAKFSIPSVIAIVCAIASFMTGAVLGLVFALAALLFGAIGFVLSLSPKIRGGVVSVLAIFAGMLGILAAVVKGVAFIL
jgi:membrane protein implicated in regulation of membrane protease activity